MRQSTESRSTDIQNIVFKDSEDKEDIELAQPCWWQGPSKRGSEGPVRDIGKL